MLFSLSSLTQKPVEKHDGTQPAGDDSKLNVTEEHMIDGLEALVDNSAKHTDVTQNIHMHGPHVGNHDWLHSMIPGIEKLASKYHMGNFVVDRDTGEKFFESMPIYARIGMHLLFYGKEQVKLLEGHGGKNKIDKILKEKSIKQGEIYDSPDSAKSIPSFVKTYNLDLQELAEPDVTKYKTFNDFFYRKLKPGARPVKQADDALSICSAADCRLTVYQTVALAQKFWIKGDEFSVPSLLGVPKDSDIAKEFTNCALSIFRLAPADYHRFHCPIDGIVDSTPHHIDGQYYTVNPQAVNEVNFDVFTANVREIVYLKQKTTGKRVAFVAVGAMLVGAVRWTGGGEKGKAVKRGEELGYFAYGGSTVICLYPEGTIEFDQDLVKNSEEPVETLVKVGYQVGKTPKSAEKRGIDKVMSNISSLGAKILGGGK